MTIGPPPGPPAALNDLLIGPDHEAGEVYEQGSIWRMTLRTFAENRLALVGIGIIVFFLLFSFVGPHLYHTDQFSGSIGDAHHAPESGHPFGTDENGFDELGRMMKGGQSSLEIGLFSAAIATVIGTAVGAIAGLVGGIVDGFLMRIVDVGLAIPTLLIVLVLATKYNGTVVSLSLVLGINAWFGPARLVRGEVLTLRERDYIAASTSMGATRSRLIMRHLLPNAMSVVIVNITFQIADAILIVSTIGYLGYGLHYPQVDWGDQLSNGVTFLQDGYWWMIYPVGVSLILVVMAFNFLGDAFRDAIDVRIRKR
jgi:peptide/nickel transport system permease protein